MSLLQSIYERSPVPVQQVSMAGLDYQNNLNRHGFTFLEQRRWRTELDTRGLPKALEYQGRELVKFIDHAVSDRETCGKLYARREKSGKHLLEKKLRAECYEHETEGSNI